MPCVTIEIYCANKLCPYFDECQEQEKSILVGPKGGVIHCTEYGGEYDPKMREPLPAPKRMSRKEVPAEKVEDPVPISKPVTGGRKGMYPTKYLNRLKKLKGRKGEALPLVVFSELLGLNPPTTCGFLSTAIRKGEAKKVSRGVYIIF